MDSLERVENIGVPLAYFFLNETKEFENSVLQNSQDTMTSVILLYFNVEQSGSMTSGHLE